MLILLMNKLEQQITKLLSKSITHLHQQQTHDEARALAIAHFPVMQGVSFHYIEQTLLAHAIFLFEKVMLWVSPCNISSYHLRNNSNVVKREDDSVNYSTGP